MCCQLTFADTGSVRLGLELTSDRHKLAHCSQGWKTGVSLTTNRTKLTMLVWGLG